jgi:hypothetical protein
MEAIGSDKQLAWHVLGTVLRAVRDRSRSISPRISVPSCPF